MGGAGALGGEGSRRNRGTLPATRGPNAGRARPSPPAGCAAGSWPGPRSGGAWAAGRGLGWSRLRASPTAPPKPPRRSAGLAGGAPHAPRQPQPRRGGRQAPLSVHLLHTRSRRAEAVRRTATPPPSLAAAATPRGRSQRPAGGTAGGPAAPASAAGLTPQTAAERARPDRRCTGMPPIKHALAPCAAEVGAPHGAKRARLVPEQARAAPDNRALTGDPRAGAGQIRRHVGRQGCQAQETTAQRAEQRGCTARRSRAAGG